jgi:hypothetical protein
MEFQAWIKLIRMAESKIELVSFYLDLVGKSKRSKQVYNSLADGNKAIEMKRNLLFIIF